MQKLLLGTLLAVLVVGCAIEKQESSGVLVDPNSDTEVPDWVTAAYLDLNKDGVINIQDLVIHSKFFGQEVPEADAIAEASGDIDESSPCGDMENRYAQFDDITVTDNTDYRQIFELDGKKYIYALIGTVKIGSGSSSNHELSEVEKAEYTKYSNEMSKAGHRRPSCIAIRFLIDENFLPVTMKTKTVAGFEYPQSISPSSLKIDTRKTPNCIDGYCNQALLNDEGLYMSGGHWSVKVLKNFNFTPRAVDPRGRWAKHYKRHKQAGIPIGNDSVITRLFLKLYEYPHKYSYISSVYYGWRLWRLPNPKSFESPFNLQDVDHGIYVKMSPTEVRRRYFPEDM